HNRGVGGHARLSLRLRSRDGLHVWVDAAIQAVYDDEGHFVHMASSLRDITDRKRAEEDLQRSVAILRGVADGTTDALFVWHVDGTYEYTNKAGAALLTHASEQPIDEATVARTESSFGGEPDAIARRLGFTDPEVQESADTTHRERELVVDGVIRNYAVRATPRRNARGLVTGI